MDNNVTLIGFERIGDLNKFDSIESLREFVEEVYPEEKAGAIKNWAHQLWHFKKDLLVGDTIVMPSKQSTIHLGKVTGNYKYITNNPEGFRHTVPVTWLKEIPRTKIDQDLLYAFGAQLTISRPRSENAEKRMLKFLGPELIDYPGDDTDDGLYDLESIANDQIKSIIISKFKGHPLADLVAAVLEAQGYVVETASEGADGGVDILAGSGSLGLQSPRLIVQVKSSESKTDVKVIRELKGLIADYHADYGLVVSWGGFTDPALKEAKEDY